MPWARVTWLAAALAALVQPLPGQRCELLPSARYWLAGSTLFAASLLLDQSLDRYAAEHRDRRLDHLANLGDELGAGHTHVPLLAGAFLASRLGKHRQRREAVDAAVAAYAAGDLVAGALKSLVGRHRPVDAESPWSFDPFTLSGTNHSWPSLHAIHIATTASAAALATHNVWVEGVALGSTGLVSWSRLYDRQHWASDVVGSVVIGVALSHLTMRWVGARHRGGTHDRCI
jgi:membrane-associated phospholipid phosphatase